MFLILSSYWSYYVENRIAVLGFGCVSRVILTYLLSTAIPTAVQSTQALTGLLHIRTRGVLWLAAL